MKTSPSSPERIDDYIAQYPEAVRCVLEQVRATIKAAAPDAQEAMKYRLPTFVLNGNLVHFGAFKAHIGLYPTPSAIVKFKDELSGYEQSKGAVQFPLDQPMPLKLIRRIVKFRVAEVRAKGARAVKSKPKSPRAARGGNAAAAARSRGKEHLHYHKDGSLWAKGQMQDGVMTGYWEWYRKDGTRMRSGHFEQGEQVGEWTTYDKDGNVVKVTTMKPKVR
jgi:uncharacterized protein YdhG (YjbR/CyaY superfamily)